VRTFVEKAAGFDLEWQGKDEKTQVIVRVNPKPSTAPPR
jgi:hypothetical protein